MSSNGGDSDVGFNEQDVQEISSHIDLNEEPRSDRSYGALDETNVSDDADRPGRYRGLDYNWMYHNQEEISIARTLAHAENDDLSLHLYNTHAWKLQHRRNQTDVPTHPWHCKERWIETGVEGSRPFLPPSHWSAWPLEPENVPRSQERWGHAVPEADDETSTFRRREPWKPSLHLQEELFAMLLRQAREGFFQRKWHDQSPERKKTTSNIQTNDASPSESGRSSFSSSEDSGEIDHLDRPIDIPKEEAGQNLEQASKDDNNVVFMDDDDAYRDNLNPIIRHIVDDLDKVLIALHKSRLGHHRSTSYSRCDRRSESRQRSRQRNNSSKPAIQRKRSASDAPTTKKLQIQHSTSEEEKFDVQTTSSKRPTERLRGHRLGLRDWSEVIGHAAVTGWDQSIVDRAAKRCAALFGESMSMRVMGDSIAEQDRDRVIRYQPSVALGTNISSEGKIERSAGHFRSGYVCSFPDCARNVYPFDELWRLRDHLRRKHKQTKDEIVVLEQQSMGELWAQSTHKKDEDDGVVFEYGYSCPFPDCPRHSNPFDHRWRMNEHLKRKHNGHQPPSLAYRNNPDGNVQNMNDIGGSFAVVSTKNSFLEPIELALPH